MTCFIPSCAICGCRIRRQCVNHDVCCDPICRVLWSVLEHVPAYPYGQASVGGPNFWPVEAAA